MCFPCLIQSLYSFRLAKIKIEALKRLTEGLIPCKYEFKVDANPRLALNNRAQKFISHLTDLLAPPDILGTTWFLRLTAAKILFWCLYD